MSLKESPFKPFGNFVVLVSADMGATASSKNDSEVSTENAPEGHDGRARNPWGEVLYVGPECKYAKQGDTVFYFYAEEVEYQGQKYLLARETDLYVALK